MKQDKIWNYYQSDTGRASFDGSYLRLHFLASKCKKNGRVLNIGVGGGIFEQIALRKGLDVYSLDPSEGAIEELRRVIGEKKAKVGFANVIPFEDNFFDSVVMSEVLEHLDTKVLEETLREVRRVLREEGVFLGTVPNEEVLSEAVVVCPDCGCTFHRWGHVQQFDKERLEKMLLQNFSWVLVKKKGWLSRESLDVKTWIYSRLNDLLYKLDMRKYNANLFFYCTK